MDQAFAEIVHIWREHGAVKAVRFVETKLETASQVERPRLLNLLSKFLKRCGELSRSKAAAIEALEKVEDTSDKADILCNLVDICGDMRLIEEGIGYARMLAELLFENPDPEVQKWRGPAMHNYGRLLALAGDYETAIARYKQAVEAFTARAAYAECASVRLRIGEAYLALNDLASAEEMARLVKADEYATPLLLTEANDLLARVAIRRGEVSVAKRYLDMAFAADAQLIGCRDFRMQLHLLNTAADLAERSGEYTAAYYMRYIVQRMASAGRIDGLQDPVRGGIEI